MVSIGSAEYTCSTVESASLKERGLLRFAIIAALGLAGYAGEVREFSSLHNPSCHRPLGRTAEMKGHG